MAKNKSDNIMFERIPTQAEINRFGGFIVEDDQAININLDFDQVPLDDASIAQLGCYLIEAKKIQSWCDNLRKLISKNCETVSVQLGKIMAEEQQPVVKQTTPEGNTGVLRVKTEAYVAIRKDDSFNTVLAYAWLLKKNLSSIIKPDIHYQTLKSCIEKYLCDDKQAVNFAPEPEGADDVINAEMQEDDRLNFMTEFHKLETQVKDVLDNPAYDEYLNSSSLPDCFTRKIVLKAGVYQR